MAKLMRDFPSTPSADAGTAARDLSRWGEFATHHLVGGPTTSIAYELQLFRSRWRLAWHFQGFNAPQFSDATVDGYSAAFRVFLAYTAHEQLTRSVGGKHDVLPLENRDLAGRIRESLRSLEKLTLANARGRQRTGLKRFWDSDTDDVRFFAYAIRNVGAHGPFTANKVKSKAAKQSLTDTAELLLLNSEREFEMVLDALSGEATS